MLSGLKMFTNPLDVAFDGAGKLGAGPERLGMPRQVRLDETWRAARPEPARVAGRSRAARIADLFDAAVEAADEKGTALCPYCFDTDVEADGFYILRRTGVKVRRFLCQSCFKRFGENWLPVGSHGLPYQLEMTFAFMSEGVPIRATSRILKILSGSIPWVVPLSNSSLHRAVREASGLLSNFERRLIEAAGGIACRSLAIISSTRRVEGGKRVAVSAVDVDSGFWLETAVFTGSPPSTFAAGLRGKIKSGPEAITVMKGAAALANQLREEFPSSKISAAPLLAGEAGRCGPPVARRVNIALARGTMELLPLIRMRFNMLEGRCAAAGIPMPRAVKGWTSLLKYAKFFLAKEADGM